MIKEAVAIESPVTWLNGHQLMMISMILLDVLIVWFIVYLGTRKQKMRPAGPQNLVEWAVMYICDYADSIIGKAHAPKYYWLLVSLFFYILVGNLLGLIPGLISPTSSLSVTVTLAVGVWIYTWVEGLMAQGPVKFFAHFAGGKEVPLPIKFILVPIELVSDISRMISLSFRLFGNILAKEIVLGVLVMLILLFGPALLKSADVLNGTINGGLFGITALLRPLIIWLGVLVCTIQAGVFTLLTATYLAGHIAAHHGEEHAEEHH